MIKVKCVHCGKKIWEMEADCPNCGRPIANRDAPITVGEKPWNWNSENRSTNTNSWPTFIIGVILSAALLIAVIASIILPVDF